MEKRGFPAGRATLHPSPNSIYFHLLSLPPTWHLEEYVFRGTLCQMPRLVRGRASPLKKDTHTFSHPFENQQRTKPLFLSKSTFSHQLDIPSPKAPDVSPEAPTFGQTQPHLQGTGCCRPNHSGRNHARLKQREPRRNGCALFEGT